MVDVMAPHPYAGGPLDGTWGRLLIAVRAGDEAATVRIVTELDDRGRKAVAAELPRYVSAEARTPHRHSWMVQLAPLLFAGVACLGGAAAVAAWLFRRDLWAARVEAGRLLGPLRRRPVAWQRDVARRVAARVRLPELRHWEVAAQLIRETGAEPPGDDGFMAGWLQSLGGADVAGDPLFAAYGPRIFEIDGLAGVRPWSIVETVARLTEDGLLDRAAVIDGVVGRMLRDGRSAPATLAASLATLHDRLGLDLDEAAARACDYTRLLSAAPVAVADLALQQLRRLEEGGRLVDELFTEAMAALTCRPEKKFLRAALSWACDAVPRDAGRADAVLAALPPILLQDTLALQERAVRLAVKLAPTAGRPGRMAIREAAAELSDDLRDRLAPAFGDLAQAEVSVPARSATGEAPRTPAPAATPQKLAEEARGFLRPFDVHAFESLLAGLAEWSNRAPGALRDALRPWLSSLEPRDYGHYGSVIHEGLDTVVPRAFLAFTFPEDSRRLRRDPAARWRQEEEPLAFDRLYLRRARELATRFEEGGGYPVLLATPTDGAGFLDAGTLLDRLETLEDAGVEALPADLTQALLRLPRAFTTAHAERAGRLTSAAGRTCAAWIRAGGLADARVSVSLREVGGHTGRYELLAELSAPASILSLPVPDAEPGTSTGAPSGKGEQGATIEVAVAATIGELFAIGRGRTDTLTWWPLVMPAHREVVAAHLVGCLRSSLGVDDGQAPALRGLALGGGPIGAGAAHALALGMGHAGADRAGATYAFLTLAARGEVPVDALAEALTTLVTADVVPLNRVVSVLDDAIQAGAHEVVWEVAVRLLPGVLPVDGRRPRAGVADLLAAATRAARIGGVRAELPEVAAIAARKGSTRLLLEARRLTYLVNRLSF